MNIIDLNTTIRNHRGDTRVEVQINGLTLYVKVTKAEAQNLFASYSVLNHTDEIPMKVTEGPDNKLLIHGE
jgi:hypothetical protein